MQKIRPIGVFNNIRILIEIQMLMWNGPKLVVKFVMTYGPLNMLQTEKSFSKLILICDTCADALFRAMA